MRTDKRGKVHYLQSDNRYICNKAVFSNGYCTRSWNLVTCKNCFKYKPNKQKRILK
jgi:hypothetical protein